MDHKGKDAHLGSTSVVKLDGRSTLQVEWDNGRSREVGLVLLASLLDISLSEAESELKSTDEKDDLGKATGGDGVEGGKAGLHGGVGKSRGDVTSKSDASGSHDMSNDGKHTNAAVLGLDVSEAVELVLVGILKKAKRIPETKRSLGTKSILEGHLESGGRCHARGRGECGGRHQGGEDGNELEHGVEDGWVK